MKNLKTTCFIFLCKILTSSDAMESSNKESVNAESHNSNPKTLGPWVWDNVCKLKQEPKKHLIYSFIQATFADQSFLEIVVTSEFTQEQVLCCIIQRIAKKMLNNKEVSIDNEINEALSPYIVNNGRNIKASDIKKKLNSLMLNIKDKCTVMSNIGLPILFRVSSLIENGCRDCDFKISYVLRINSEVECFGHELQESVKTIANSAIYNDRRIKFKCKKCNKSILQPFVVADYGVPNQFIVWSERWTIYHKEKAVEEGKLPWHDGVNDAPRTLAFDDMRFELYAVICLYITNNDDIVSSYTIAKRGLKWFVFDENEPREAQLENGELKEQKMHIISELKTVERKDDDKNGENNSEPMEDEQILVEREVHSNRWIYFYRDLKIQVS